MLKQELLEKIRRAKLVREDETNQYYLELVDSINRATSEYVAAQNGFSETANRDLTDFYIYRMKSLEAKYRYLMKEYRRVRTQVAFRQPETKQIHPLCNVKI